MHRILSSSSLPRMYTNYDLSLTNMYIVENKQPKDRSILQQHTKNMGAVRYDASEQGKLKNVTSSLRKSCKRVK